MEWRTHFLVTLNDPTVIAAIEAYNDQKQCNCAPPEAPNQIEIGGLQLTYYPGTYKYSSAYRCTVVTDDKLEALPEPLREARIERVEVELTGMPVDPNVEAGLYRRENGPYLEAVVVTYYSASNGRMDYRVYGPTLELVYRYLNEIQNGETHKPLY